MKSLALFAFESQFSARAYVLWPSLPCFPTHFQLSLPSLGWWDWRDEGRSPWGSTAPGSSESNLPPKVPQVGVIATALEVASEEQQSGGGHCGSVSWQFIIERYGDFGHKPERFFFFFFFFYGGNRAQGSTQR